jgi:serine/threonine-protein kinase
VLNERTSVVAQVRPSKTPDAMVERARTVLSKAGYTWQNILREAGLDPAGWTSVAPAKRPRFVVDTRVAWEGRLSAAAEIPARIEATALDGRMVTFEIVGPWHSDPSRRAQTAGAAGTPASRLTNALGGVVVPINAVLFLTGAFFARQNLRRGRGDRRGATKLAVFGSAVTMTGWLFTGRGVVPMYTALGYTLYLAAFVWVFYVAVEPFVRRRWPTMLVAWVRVLAGNVRNPLVGRDVLIGCATGVAGACLTALNRMVAWQAGNPNALLLPDWFMFNGTGPFIGAVLAQSATGLFVSVLTLFLFFLFRVIVRSDWIALPLFALLVGASRIGGAGIASGVAILVLVACGALRTFTLVRIGLVAAIVDAFVWTLFATSPMTLQTSAWYSSAGYVSLGIIGAIAIYGFRTALGGRPVLDGAAIGD